MSLDDYPLSLAIGRGSFSSVFLSIPSQTAIKQVSKSSLNRKLLANLQQEINILTAINHANIVRLLRVIDTNTDIYLVMEFCSLGDLSLFIRKKGAVAPIYPPNAQPLPPLPGPWGGLLESVARHFLSQIVSALQFLRSKSLIHRDLKPQNILLSPTMSNPTIIYIPSNSQQPSTNNSQQNNSANQDLIQIALPTLKLADFGFARALPQQSLASTLCGSPLYMAPEILRGDKYDAKADLWSLGAILYELIAGRPPFRAQNHIELLRKIDRGDGWIRFPGEPLDDHPQPIHTSSSQQSQNAILQQPTQRPLKIPSQPQNFPASLPHQLSRRYTTIGNHHMQNNAVNINNNDPHKRSFSQSPSSNMPTPIHIGSLGSSPKYIHFTRPQNIPPVPPDLKDVIRRLLQRNPIQRITFEELFMHESVVSYQPRSRRSSYAIISAGTTTSVAAPSSASTSTSSHPSVPLPIPFPIHYTQPKTQLQPLSQPVNIANATIVSPNPVPLTSKASDGSSNQSQQPAGLGHTKSIRDLGTGSLKRRESIGMNIGSAGASMSPKTIASNDKLNAKASSQQALQQPTESQTSTFSAMARTIDPPFPIYGPTPLMLESIIPSNIHIPLPPSASTKPTPKTELIPPPPPPVTTKSTSMSSGSSGSVRSSVIGSFVFSDDDGETHAVHEHGPTTTPSVNAPPSTANRIAPKSTTTEAHQHKKDEPRGRNTASLKPPTSTHQKSDGESSDTNGATSDEFVVVEKRVVEVTWVDDDASDRVDEKSDELRMVPVSHSDKSTKQEQMQQLPQSNTHKPVSGATSAAHLTQHDAPPTTQTNTETSNVDHDAMEYMSSVFDPITRITMQSYTLNKVCDQHYTALMSRIQLQPDQQPHDADVTVLADETVMLYVMTLGVYQTGMDLCQRVYRDHQPRSMTTSSIISSHHGVSESTKTKVIQKLAPVVVWIRDRFSDCIYRTDMIKSAVSTQKDETESETRVPRIPESIILDHAITISRYATDLETQYQSLYSRYNATSSSSSVPPQIDMHDMMKRLTEIETVYTECKVMYESVLTVTGIGGHDQPDTVLRDDDCVMIEKLVMGVHDRIVSVVHEKERIMELMLNAQDE